MKAKLKIECQNCKRVNQIEVQKTIIQPDSSEPKVQVFLPSYLVKETKKCEKCKTVLAEPNELFRITNGKAVRYRIKYDS